MVTAPAASKGDASSSPATTSHTLHASPRPWYRYITLDVIVVILANSVFHPWIALVFYLCLAAVHKHREPLAYYTLWYTAVLAVVELALYLDHRVTFGRHRKVDWEKEVVVITGGARGLGRVLAQMALRKGARVAVLDVEGPDEEADEEMERWDLLWETVDVAREEEVRKAVDRIVEELGPPTILVNNAASAVTGLPLASSPGRPSALSPERTRTTLAVNAVSHFNTLAAILPHLISSPTGAHVITLSSVLARLSPACLADYSASKAAVASLHATLAHELRAHPDPAVFARVKTLLVEPGQISTQLFAGITSLPFYAHFFGPVLEAKDVAREILRVVERGDGGVIRMPFYAKCLPLYGVMPGSLKLLVRWFCGIDRAVVERAHDKMS